MRARREAAGLTRAELARRAGISEALIQQIEQGTRQPTPVSPADIERRPIRVRSPETGEWVSMHVQLFEFELPQRPWWIYSLVPVG